MRYTPIPVRYEITLAPAHNALVSFAALTSPLEIYEDEGWVSETAEALSDAQRQHNRLVFEVFGEAIVPEREYPDVPTYLAALADTPPERLRERVLSGFANADAWQAQHSIDSVLREQAQELINDPSALRELIVGHLSELWNRFFAAVWRRRLSQLQGFQLFLQQREFPTTSAGDLLRGLLNREVPDWIAAQLGGVRQVMFVLQPHVRLFAARFSNSDTLWVFACPSPENLAVRSAPIKRIELVLQYLASKFEAGREYSEPEVNKIINQWHSYQDHASLRRELYDNWLIDRTSDGARYWLASKNAEEQ